MRSPFLYSFMTLLATVQFPWVVYHGTTAPPEAFESFNPIVMDGFHHIPLEPLLKKKKELLGYVALGEVTERDDWFLTVKNHSLLIKENSDWPTSWSVDIRNAFWKQLLLEDVIPRILAQGYTGLFFDQLDISIDLEIEDPVKYRGMTAAAVDLVKAISQRFPHCHLMMNRAYEILKEVGPYISYELAETLYSSYDFEKKKYFVRPKQEFEWQLEQLNAARKQFPHLVLFSLDYWDPKDKEMYKKIYALEQEQGMRPYVSTPALGLEEQN